ncbi:cytochrome P450 [Streptomyces tendae]|uniref:cytochrome P450 n=1 Tax=Streptomyces tendae TaxID=1932 RepID=UPI0037AEF139
MTTLTADCADLTDPHTFLAPDAELVKMWRRTRSHNPVYWHRVQGRAVPGFWVLSRYHDVMEVYRDSKRFTSQYGNVLATLLEGGDSAAGKMLAVTDGRRHRDLRNVMLKAFAPRVLEPVVAKVRERTDRLVRRAVEAGDCDFAKDVAEHIPMATIADLLGVPAGDREDLLALTKEALSTDDDSGSADEAVVARNELLFYFAQLAAVRRKDPRDDVLSVLTTSTVNGEPLTEQEIILNCYSIIIGGDETSRLSMISGMRALMEHPQQWRRLTSGDVGVDSAVEEILRWASPAMHFGRRAREDAEIGGRLLRAGDVVTLWISSANYDEDVFADPGTFDLGRTPNKHVAFGYGPHFCPGAYLGRAEIAAMLLALRTHVGDAVPNGPARPIHSNFLHGYSSLPISLTPAPAR